MRFKLLLLMVLSVAATAMAQNASVTGTVVDAVTGQPLNGVTVMLRDQGLYGVADLDGNFRIEKARAGKDMLIAADMGYRDGFKEVELFNNQTVHAGRIALEIDDINVAMYDDQQDALVDRNALEEEETSDQTINALVGATDNIYYNVSNYDFSAMYFRFRGYNSEYQTTYINGIEFNDLIRGRFNYSTLGGMTSRAFRNRTSTIGLGAAAYGFGGVGGSTNISTITSEYAPGFNGTVSYTNSNYMLRAMATYSTGINKNGWGLTVSAIGRYSKEGVVEGTFYNSGGYFLSLEKEFNKEHSLTLTAFGAPTQRAGASATYQEAYDLAGTNLYNPNWGWQDGKKRASRIIETFDPTFILNWIFKPKEGTTLNTGAAFRWVNYSTSALNWYNANDPKPDYYRNLPSNFADYPDVAELYAERWRTDEAVRQINWDELYYINELNNIANNSTANVGNQKGSSYILENRHSNEINAMFNSTLNTRLNSFMSLQAGVGFNYTKGSYYKTIRDLLGGEFWVDIDPFSDREITIAPQMLQNDLDNPNRRVGKGDKFGYDYNINAFRANGWLQNVISLPQWDINYGLEMSFTSFFRDGHMRNGRSPNNSLGKGQTHKFDNGSVKAGVTYKLDGRNIFMAHAQYGTRAPLIESVYISPRIKDDAVANPESERILSVDASYVWNYRRFRGNITAFYTEMNNQIERTAFYDDNYSTFSNYVLSGVNKTYKGIEVGMAYKITPSLTATLAGTYSSYRYKNNPQGTRSFENGLYPDTTQTIYLKNAYVGGTPQTAVNLGFDWAAPHNWFFGINGSWMGNAYVKLSPVYHEAQPELWKTYSTEEALMGKIRELAELSKLNDAFVLNASIGKLVYINRKVSMNFNLNVDNILNNRNIMNNGYQQGRMDRTNWTMTKYPNKYSYSQGIKVFLNVGVRF